MNGETRLRRLRRTTRLTTQPVSARRPGRSGTNESGRLHVYIPPSSGAGFPLSRLAAAWGRSACRPGGGLFPTLLSHGRRQVVLQELDPVKSSRVRRAVKAAGGEGTDTRGVVGAPIREEDHKQQAAAQPDEGVDQVVGAREEHRGGVPSAAHSCRRLALCFLDGPASDANGAVSRNRVPWCSAACRVCCSRVSASRESAAGPLAAVDRASPLWPPPRRPAKGAALAASRSSRHRSSRAAASLSPRRGSRRKQQRAGRKGLPPRHGTCWPPRLEPHGLLASRCDLRQRPRRVERTPLTQTHWSHPKPGADGGGAGHRAGRGTVARRPGF